MNELGVIFTPPGARPAPEPAPSTFETDRSSTRGSVEGSRYYSQAAHFEWLVDFGKPLGLRFEDQHTAHTEDELRQTAGEPGFDEEKFLHDAATMLNGALDKDRIYARARPDA